MDDKTKKSLRTIIQLLKHHRVHSILAAKRGYYISSGNHEKSHHKLRSVLYIFFRDSRENLESFEDFIARIKSTGERSCDYCDKSSFDDNPKGGGMDRRDSQGKLRWFCHAHTDPVYMVEFRDGV